MILSKPDLISTLQMIPDPDPNFTRPSKKDELETHALTAINKKYIPHVIKDNFLRS
jgi:hypothetical protein